MSIGKIEAQDVIKTKTVPVFTDVETYSLADVVGQKGWFRHPSHPNPGGQFAVVGGSQVEGIQSLALQARAGIVQNTQIFREFAIPVIFPYDRMEMSWKTKMLSTMTIPYSLNLVTFPNVPANPETSLDYNLYFGMNSLGLGHVEIWFGSVTAAVWEKYGTNDNTVHSYKWVVASQGLNQPGLCEVYYDDVLVATRVGGGGAYSSPSQGDIPESFSHINLQSSMNNDVPNSDKMFIDSIQIKVIR